LLYFIQLYSRRASSPVHQAQSLDKRALMRLTPSIHFNSTYNTL
jgi:hypothetical protein